MIEIEISEFNSSDIRSVAVRNGITHMKHIGGGYADGKSEMDDYYVSFYEMTSPKGWSFRVADTNSDPVWEETDPQGFAELAESCGVEL